MAIEEHRFAAVTRVRWRNDRLEFGSIEALTESLARRPTRGVLRYVGDAEDAMAFARLVGRPDVAAVARGEDRVRLPWSWASSWATCAPSFAAARARTRGARCITSNKAWERHAPTSSPIL